MSYDTPNIKKSLNQYEMDRYIDLSKAYLGGSINIPFEIQLAAYDKSGEEPYNIKLDPSINLTVVEFLREIIPLRDRKKLYGVGRGVDDPEALLEIKQQAVIIYTRCALEIAESEVMEETTGRMTYFPIPIGAHIGKNGYFHLFAGYKDSPVALYRGDGGAFNALECIEFISHHFPDVEDEILKSLGG